MTNNINWAYLNIHPRVDKHLNQGVKPLKLGGVRLYSSDVVDNKLGHSINLILAKLDSIEEPSLARLNKIELNNSFK